MGTRLLVVTASARNCPVLMKGCEAATLSNMNETEPAIRSGNACELPR